MSMHPTCTLCDQDLLYRVEIIPDALGTFIICAECERMWKPDEAYDPSRAIDFVSFMESRRHKPLWENLKKLERIAPVGDEPNQAPRPMG